MYYRLRQAVRELFTDPRTFQRVFPGYFAVRHPQTGEPLPYARFRELRSTDPKLIGQHKFEMKFVAKQRTNVETQTLMKDIGACVRSRHTQLQEELKKKKITLPNFSTDDKKGYRPVEIRSRPVNEYEYGKKHEAKTGGHSPTTLIALSTTYHHIRHLSNREKRIFRSSLRKHMNALQREIEDAVKKHNRLGTNGQPAR